MPREIVSAEKLLEIINAELAKHDVCDGCRITNVQAHEQDEEGCNWSSSNLQCSGVPAEVCLPVAHHVVRTMRGKYNLT